ncbi:hypothetical protein BJ508DRAFT_328673 [Ascobolus immersus RN42]|uniref:Uncharacterized protein n=1 Tax=Ascobolus immersus RN42 TaxID=1160509 RepID=A0A3N4I156_ASCIM|nr:hypothetical protein BJ508DRAFT_328673 [Ascobolus immersus RN42]
MVTVPSDALFDTPDVPPPAYDTIPPPPPHLSPPPQPHPPPTPPPPAPSTPPSSKPPPTSKPNANRNPTAPATKTPTTSAVEAAVSAACKESTPYSLAMMMEGKNEQKHAPAHNSILFRPYKGQCEHGALDGFVTPVERHRQTFPGPVQVKVPEGWRPAYPSAEMLHRLTKLEKKYGIPITNLPVPESLKQYFLPDGARAGTMYCLTRPLEEEYPGVINRPRGAREMMSDNSIERELERQHKRRKWTKVQDEIEGYKEKAVQIMPVDGYTWKEEARWVAAGGETPVWYCWLRKAMYLSK